MDVKCPACGSEVTFKLHLSKIAYSHSHLRRIGGPPAPGYATPRTVLWDCTNEECEQRKGHPKPPRKTIWQDARRQKWLEKLEASKKEKEEKEKDQ